MARNSSRSFVYIRDVSAMPPLFLLKSAKKCASCGEQNHLIVIGAAVVKIDNKTREEPHLFYHITDLPEALEAELGRYPFGKTGDSPDGFPIYTNLCGSCGSLIGDFKLLARPDDILAADSSIYDIDSEELAIASTVELRAHVKRLPRAFRQMLQERGILPGLDRAF